MRGQLGHSSIKMTVDVYGHFIPGANRQAVNNLPSLTSPIASDRETASGTCTPKKKSATALVALSF